jgi:formylglycine-generating enzyme required for sulfatase activity
MRRPIEILLLAAWPVFVAAAMPAAAQSSQDRPTAGAGSDDEERRIRRLGDAVAPTADEWSMDIPAIETAPPVQRPNVSLPDAQRDARLQTLLDELARRGSADDIERRLGALMQEVRDAALAAVGVGDLETASARQRVLAELAPALGVADVIATARAARAERATRVGAIRSALDAGRLVEPLDASAVYHLAALREFAPQAPETLDWTARVRAALQARFDALLQSQRLLDARALLGRVDDATVPPAVQVEWLERLDRRTRERIAVVRARAESELAAGRAGAARASIDRLRELGAPAVVIAVLGSKLERVQRYGRFAPGERFADALPGDAPSPEMIVVTAGRSWLGGVRDAPEASVDFESGYALARTEITVAQFRAFVDDTGYLTDAERQGASAVFDPRAGVIGDASGVDWRRDFQGRSANDDDAVTHVSWNDAAAYAAWLRETTGQDYRLPSEAEFEHALRAGTTTPFWWGDGAPEEPLENLAGDGDRFGRDQRWTDAFNDYRDRYWGPAAVATFEPNPFGFFDLGGNLMEWTADCWNEDYGEMPRDGSAWRVAGCGRRVLRGGSWASGPDTAHSAYRLSGPSDFSDARIGFRVARDLTPGDGD